MPEAKYKHNNVDAFADFEPYYCGPLAIPEGIYGEFTSTNNFQSFVRNGYTEEVLASKLVEGETDKYYSYKIDGKTINGCKRGTVILANHPDHAATIKEGNDNTSIWVSGDIGSQTLHIGAAEFNENYFAEKGLIFPKRLGILLVGGGGGSGGSSWYDAKKDGKKDDRFMCVGGSGGGGGIIWGVIDLEKTKPSSLLPISITVGSGGNGGGNANTDGLTHNKPKKGGNGAAGTATTLAFIFKNIALDIAWANGGDGGAAGHWENTAGGGEGGNSGYNTEYFVCCGAINGLSGISTQKNMTDATISARTNSFQFLPDVTDDGRFTYKLDTIAARQTKLATDSSARIPGGHSFGSGAYQDTVAGYGGGGCSNGANGSNNGGGGYWMVFYA